MKAVVVEPHERPYDDPIAVAAGDRVVPRFDKVTEIAGWVWYTAGDGRSGWTPERWLVRSGDAWRLDRDFHAIELTAIPGQVLEIMCEESSFFWAGSEDGASGWIPCACVSLDDGT